MFYTDFHGQSLPLTANSAEAPLLPAFRGSQVLFFGLSKVLVGRFCL